MTEKDKTKKRTAEKGTSKTTPNSCENFRNKHKIPQGQSPTPFDQARKYNEQRKNDGTFSRTAYMPVLKGEGPDCSPGVDR